MAKKRWIIRDRGNEDSIKLLIDQLNIPDILANLLVQRNINNFADAKKFFRPDINSIYNPFLMNGMEEATSRVIHAITNNERIVIYGDYDVDGTCATAILVIFLKQLGADVLYYIPNRLTEGYGVSEAGIDFTKESDAKLLITVDCGITAITEADYAKQQGLDMIICDHHQPKEILPDAFAILDPIKPGCDYPFKYLSGAGVAFKLVQGICERIGNHNMHLQFLDLVALAGSADIVPLIDENRVLVYEGLNIINTNPRPGVKALIESAGLQHGTLSAAQIVFTLAPRINAVGRLSDAKIAVELLTSEDINLSRQYAVVLETENRERRKIDEDTLKRAISLADSCFDAVNDKALILHEENWHPGVIGIVASRLVEKYYRPTVMLTTIDGVAKGSARSIQNFNVYGALKECEEMLIHFGGHEAAAGVAIELSKIDEFREKFNRVVGEKLNQEDLLPLLSIDTEIMFSDITPKFLRILEQFAPFGPANMRPQFITRNVKIISCRKVGTNHLLLTVKQEGYDRIFDCIAFNFASDEELKTFGQSLIDIVFTIDTMKRDGKIFPQLKLKDYRISKEIN